MSVADAAAPSPRPARTQTAALPRSAAGFGGPWLMTAVVSIATFMEILDTSIANVALDTISGNLGVSVDQGTWMVTSYLVANAIVIPISGWLSAVIGRKRYFLISVALFVISSFMCALAPNLEFLILARVFQGIGGGGLAPVEQSMIADSFPPQKRGPAFAAFGFVVVVAPIIGPTIGGYITDTISWHWLFLINIPVGIVAFIASALIVVEADVIVKERVERLKNGLNFDWVGFTLLAIGLGALLILLDRGQTENWFSSDLIRAMTVMAIAGLGGMIVWELSHDDPIVPIHLLAKRNFAICSLLIALIGVLIFGTIQLVPQMLQSVFQYNATNAGLALTYGGWIAALMMPLSGMIVGKVDTRLILMPAFALEAYAFWGLSQFSVDSTFGDAAWARFIISLGLPFLFIPISTVAYVGLKPGEAAQASAMINFFRNLGGAFGISLCQTMLSQRQQYHQSRIVETLSPLNPNYANDLAQRVRVMGSQQTALATMYSEVQRQAAMLSFTEIYRVLLWFVLAVLPLILVLRVARGAPPPGAAAH